MGSIRKSSFTLAMVVMLALTAFSVPLATASNVDVERTQTVQTALPDLAASQDTFIRQGQANTNFAGAVFLGVDGSAGEIERTFISFNVTGIPAGATVNSATLRVWTRPPTSVTGDAATATDGSAQMFQVALTSTGWSAASVTYNSPLTCGAPVTTFGPLSSTQTAYTANVTSAVTGNGEVAFCIRLVDETSGDGIKLESLEGTAGRAPTLIIEYTEAAPGGGVTPPPTGGGTTGGTTAPVVRQTKPGPDMIPIPEWATGGKIVNWTHAYYLPLPEAAGTVELAPGTSVWVFGIDASGQFYLAMLSGKKFWVPASDIGPNYEDPWYGRPLPTTVVEG